MARAAGVAVPLSSDALPSIPYRDSSAIPKAAISSARSSANSIWGPEIRTGPRRSRSSSETRAPGGQAGRGRLSHPVPRLVRADRARAGGGHARQGDPRTHYQGRDQRSGAKGATGGAAPLDPQGGPITIARRRAH